MGLTRPVVDASVAVSWVIVNESDPRAESARAEVERDGGIVPQHWHLEVRNALVVAERRRRITRQAADLGLDFLKSLPIITDSEHDLDVALALARSHELSFYDAVYLELAKRENAELATLDGGLGRAAIAEGVSLVV